MASTVQSLFPELAQQLMADPVAMARANAPKTVEQSFLQDIAGVGASLQENITGAFGQQTQQQRLQGIIQQAQSEADLSTPQGLLVLANKLNEYPEFSGMALSMRQQAATLAQESALKEAQTKKALAEAQKATREKEPSVLDQARQTVIDLGSRTDLNPTQQQALTNAREVLKLASPGTTVTVGDKAATEAAGKIVGQNVAQIENKYSAIDSIKEARNVLNQGIYAGIIGPEKQFIAKITGGLIGDKDKVARTEEFLSYIGNTVIPRLTEFGGNDSVEELRYLTRVMGGDQRLEPESLKRILDSAERKIQRGIRRIQTQTEALQVGRQLPLGPNAEPTAPPSATKTTKRKTKSGIEYEVIED